jgi:hypothetical protein
MYFISHTECLGAFFDFVSLYMEFGCSFISDIILLTKLINSRNITIEYFHAINHINME